MTRVSKAKQEGSGALLRRRVGAGCVHPVYVEGKITAWRGLASYQDPVTGKRHRRSVTRKTYRAAERALRALLKTLPATARTSRRGAAVVALPPATDGVTLLAFLHRWLDYRQRDLRPNTYRSYVNELLHLIPHLGDLPLATLTPLQIQEAMTERLEHELSTAKSLATALRTLRMALRQAVLWGVLPSNPASLVRTPRTRPKEMKVWSPPEARRFLGKAQGHRLHPFFVLALGTGMRLGELTGLSWADISLDKAELVVSRNHTRDITGAWRLGEPKTRAGHRCIPLGEDVVGVLREHLAEEEKWFGARRGPDPVFTRSSGARLDHANVTRLFHRLGREAGVPRIRFHDIRHTSASLLIRQGISPKVVSDRLGHADVAFTLSVYTHLYEDQRRSAALPLDQLLSSPPSGMSSAPVPEQLIAQLQALLTQLTTGPVSKDS